MEHETIARCVHSTIRSKEEDNRVTDQDARNILTKEEFQVFNSEIITNGLPRAHTPNQQDYENLRPYFAWLPTKLIKETFKNSTQFAFMPASPDGNLFKRWKSPNPAMNVFRLNDDILVDKIYSNTPAIDGAFKEAHIFFGRKSHIIHFESASKLKKFIHCLQNFVRNWGAPLRIIADHAKYHESFQVLDYLRLLWIGLWFSEAYYQHQNPFERRYQTFKRIVNRTMDRTGTPPELWFLCMCYAAYVINRVSDPTLNNKQPIFAATGQLADISSITTFQWLEPVYYQLDNSQYQFPSTSREQSVRRPFAQ